MKTQVKSKQHVIEYGEVLTPKPTVNTMLDLVKQETERKDSRFFSVFLWKSPMPPMKFDLISGNPPYGVE